MNSFERTIGPGADVKELEYVSALHQTSMPNTRPDGTISSLDILRYLRSRHSLEISHLQAREIVLGLGGGSLCEAVTEELVVEQRTQLQEGEPVVTANTGTASKSFWKRKSREEEIRQEAEEEEMDVQAELLNPTFVYLDLVQTASILLIPALAGIGQKWKQRNNERMASGGVLESFDSALEGERPSGGSNGSPETSNQGGQKEDELVVDDPSLKNLIQDVLHILFKNSEPSNGQSGKGAPLVTPELVKGLLLENQEEERAKDSALIQRMVDAAHSPSGRLDEEAFLNALTSDLNGYEDGCEVMPSLISRKEKTREAPGDEEEPKTNPAEVTKINALRIIDSVVDEYASSAMLLLIWLFFLASSAMFGSLLTSTSAFEAGCKQDGDNSFGCTLLSTIYTWLTLALVLTGTGLVVIIPVSLGNHPTKREPGRLLLAFFVTTAYSVIPYASITQYQNHSVSEPFEGPEVVVTSEYFDAWKIVALSLGLVCAAMYLFQFCLALGKKFDWLDENSRFAKFFVTSNVRGAARLKKAASHKIGLVLENARRMHGPISAPSWETAALSESTRNLNTDPIFRNFVLYGETTVTAGSIIWTWANILNESLFEVEGVWLPARLLIFQGAQIIFGSVLSFLLVIGVEPLAKRADDAQADLDEDLAQWVRDIVPTGSQVRYALYPASGVAIFMIGAIALVYMPSTVKTILKYRCGQTPSLGSMNFSLYRTSVDATHTNTANGVYAMLAGAGLFWVLIALAIFLFIWPFSQDFMLLLMAWGIGLTITIVLKMVVTGYFRKKTYRAYYRVNPKVGNISALALECWFLGLGGGVLVGRITQFLLAAAFWIGRIDVPFLSEDVQLFGYAFDYIPVNFVKELLVHEAHRHPYIERLGEMYLIRLRQGNSFGSDAGSCWRQLFVVALMPWLIKHRVYHGQRSANSMADLLGEAKLKLDEDRNRFKEVVQGAVDTGAAAVTGVEDLSHTVLDAGSDVVHVGKGPIATFGGLTKDAVDIATFGGPRRKVAMLDHHADDISSATSK